MYHSIYEIKVSLLLNINTILMKNKIKVFLGTGVAIATLLIIGAPLSAFAATYAYVDTNGEVKMVIASNPTIAIDTAPNRAVHSGVILLSSPNDYDIVDN